MTQSKDAPIFFLKAMLRQWGFTKALACQGREYIMTRKKCYKIKI